MYKKYGAAKFSVGCIMIANWVNFELRNIPVSKVKKWNAGKVNQMCNALSEESMVYEEAEALRQIFGLQSINDLYTNNQ